MQNILFWFRNDLRLHDNEAFLRACDMGRVIPVYVIDVRQFEKLKLGFRKSDHFRARFLLESLQNLKENLQKRGSDLIIRIGKPEEELAKIAEEQNVLYVLASKEVTQEETSLEFELSQRLKRLNIDIELVWGATLYHVRDLPFQIKFLPDVFTEFRKKMDVHAKVRPLFGTPEKLNDITEIDAREIPSMKDLGFEEDAKYKSSFFKGGEDAGLAQLHSFIWKTENIKTYKETRNQLLGDDFSSKLSAWLSLGCVSPRKIYHEVRLYEEKVLKNESTYWVIFELIWRDYFHLVALKYGIRLFKRCGIQHDLIKTWRQNREEFQKWMDGETGVPFVDANMRELKETGFMSNRGRQIVASFFTKDLKLEWWWGAMYFESALIDYDVCSNWGNWNYIAGIGNDPRPNRYFHVLKQADKYDTNAEYVKKWVPELKSLTKEEIGQLYVFDNEVNINYPKPIVKLP
jgi:deoxyribodipyrimidine photo-lyase